MSDHIDAIGAINRALERLGNRENLGVSPKQILTDLVAEIRAECAQGPLREIVVCWHCRQLFCVEETEECCQLEDERWACSRECYDSLLLFDMEDRALAAEARLAAVVELTNDPIFIDGNHYVCGQALEDALARDEGGDSDGRTGTEQPSSAVDVSGAADATEQDAPAAPGVHAITTSPEHVDETGKREHGEGGEQADSTGEPVAETSREPAAPDIPKCWKCGDKGWVLMGNGNDYECDCKTAPDGPPDAVLDEIVEEAGQKLRSISTSWEPFEIIRAACIRAREMWKVPLHQREAIIAQDKKLRHQEVKLAAVREWRAQFPSGTTWASLDRLDAILDGKEE